MNVKKLLSGLVAISSLAAAQFAHAEITTGAITHIVNGNNISNVCIGAEATCIQKAASIDASNGASIRINGAVNQQVQVSNLTNLGIGYKVHAEQLMASVSAK